MDVKQLTGAFGAIAETMAANTDYLVELDARFGDGDLGISMRDGFGSVAKYLATSTETDIGMALRGCSTAFNETAPSSLGTILSFAMMGMAKALRGKKEAGLAEMADALQKGVTLIMEKAKSKPGEKTILDSLVPGTEALNAHAQEGTKAALEAAYAAAQEGLENTKNMVGKHGRIAYYGEQTLGSVDGGAAVGMLLFRALQEYFA